MVKKIVKKSVKKVKKKSGPKLKHAEKGVISSCYLPKGMLDRVKFEADKAGKSKNDILFDALTRYFA
jgi:hypothetical protein